MHQTSLASPVGVRASSPVFDLIAVDATTFDRVTTFASAPTLTVSYDPSKPAPTSIYYVDPVNGPVAIPSTVDETAHTITAQLPHFSLYVAGQQIDGVLDAIQSTLQDYVNGALAGTQTITLTDDAHVGGVLALAAPTLVFTDIAFSGTGANTTFTGTVGITATSSDIDAAPFSGSTGAISGTYTLAGEGARRRHAARSRSTRSRSRSTGSRASAPRTSFSSRRRPTA